MGLKREFKTKSGIKINNELVKVGYNVHSGDTIAFCYTEGEDIGYVSFNFSSTTIKFPLSEINMSELPEDEIKIWATWTWR